MVSARSFASSLLRFDGGFVSRPIGVGVVAVVGRDAVLAPVGLRAGYELLERHALLERLHCARDRRTT
jgi:hypothetical protein